MKLTDQTILVTGGAGFIGSHLVEALIERGFSVVVLDNLRNGSRANLAKVSASPQFRFIHGDILDLNTCHRACQDAEIVFHLACLGGRHSLPSPPEREQGKAIRSVTR